jgi:hypothetical protein
MALIPISERTSHEGKGVRPASADQRASAALVPLASSAMYAFRLIYYGYWHLLWGTLRLELLF